MVHKRPPGSQDPAAIAAWLRTRPSAADMAARFPADWQYVQAELAAAVAARDFARLHRLLHPWEGKRQPTFEPGRCTSADANAALRQRMAALAVEHYSLSAVSGSQGGARRLNLLNAWMAQRLLFVRDFERKPVALRAFNMVWPLIWQRRRLMPLVERKGIYCFYSREFVDALARLVGTRSCHEIGAGDGTLARFLSRAGVMIAASDNYSWSDRIDYPAEVLRMDASAALRRFEPQVVICSWPPAGNGFEQHIFRTPSVELYVAIVSRHEFAAGNQMAYRNQQEFEVSACAALSALLLPPELGCQVLLFERRRR